MTKYHQRLTKQRSESGTWLWIELILLWCPYYAAKFAAAALGATRFANWLNLESVRLLFMLAGVGFATFVAVNFATPGTFQHRRTLLFALPSTRRKIREAMGEPPVPSRANNFFQSNRLRKLLETGGKLFGALFVLSLIFYRPSARVAQEDNYILAVMLIVVVLFGVSPTVRRSGRR